MDATKARDEVSRRQHAPAAYLDMQARVAVAPPGLIVDIGGGGSVQKFQFSLFSRLQGIIPPSHGLGGMMR